MKNPKRVVRSVVMSAEVASMLDHSAVERGVSFSRETFDRLVRSFGDPSIETRELLHLILKRSDDLDEAMAKLVGVIELLGERGEQNAIALQAMEPMLRKISRWLDGLDKLRGVVESRAGNPKKPSSGDRNQSTHTPSEKTWDRTAIGAAFGQPEIYVPFEDDEPLQKVDSQE
jgi:hypothetical protein